MGVPSGYTSAQVVQAVPTGINSALVLIKRATFSNVATTTTTFDSVFTSTYKSYMVIIEQIYAATDTDDLHLLFRYGGTSATAAYYSSTILSPSNTTVSNSNVSNGAQVTLATDTGNSTIPSGATLFFHNIGSGSSKPQVHGQLMSGVGAPTIFTFGGYQNTAQSYDGFLLKSSSTNITGTVSVYGLVTA